MHAPPQSMLRAALPAKGSPEFEARMREARNDGSSLAPHLLARLEYFNQQLAIADDRMTATLTTVWGPFKAPPVEDYGAEGKLIQLLDVLDQRIDAINAHAKAFETELGA